MIQRRTLVAGLAGLAGLATTALTLATPAFAQQAVTEGIEISGGFARATPSLAKVGVAFMTLTSRGGADRLVGYSSLACNRPELHTHIENDGVMQMRKVEAIDVPAGGLVALEPGGLHLMMVDLNHQLVEGETLEITLHFEVAGEVAVTVPVLGVGAMTP